MLCMDTFNGEGATEISIMLCSCYRPNGPSEPTVGPGGLIPWEPHDDGILPPSHLPQSFNEPSSPLCTKQRSHFMPLVSDKYLRKDLTN